MIRRCQSGSRSSNDSATDTASVNALSSIGSSSVMGHFRAARRTRLLSSLFLSPNSYTDVRSNPLQHSLRLWAVLADSVGKLPMKEVNLAVVGLGYWGPNILRNAWELDGVRVSVICDRDEEALARQARRYGDSRLATDFQEVLDDDSVDAVCVVTPISTHYPMCKAALEAGKHVFVE